MVISSACTQGLVMALELFTSQRKLEHSFKAHKQICSIYDDEYELLIGSYYDQKVRIFNEQGLNIYYEMDIYPATYHSVHIDRQLEIILFGTAQGSVRAYLWPFQNFALKQQEYFEIALHQGPVTNIKISPDLSFLVSGSEDGSIFMSKVKEFRDGTEITATEVLSGNVDRGTFTLANLYNFNALTFISRANQEGKKD